MDVTKQYAIAWKGLKNGTYRFDFKVDNALFEAYGSTDIKDGDLSVGVTLERGESMLSLQTVIRGTVTVACDRCLEDCRLPVAFDGTLLVRFSDEVADNIFMRASYSRCPTSGCIPKANATPTCCTVSGSFRRRSFRRSNTTPKPAPKSRNRSTATRWHNLPRSKRSWKAKRSRN